jgi:hypothetical protein
MTYEQLATKELKAWQKRMSRRPGLLDGTAKRLQTKVNSFIPEKVHQGITTVIKQMVRGVLFGSSYTVGRIDVPKSFIEKEMAVRGRIETYRKAASIEGGITGAGGILLGLADFPILLGIKLKMLFDIATLYGYDVKDYKERLYILQIFQLAFSSQEHKRNVFQQIIDWNEKSKTLPDDINAFDWRSFQQEYRDHIDLAKMAQLIPGIGAVVGVVVNYRLINKLGDAAMNAYRMRVL